LAVGDSVIADRIWSEYRSGFWGTVVENFQVETLPPALAGENMRFHRETAGFSRTSLLALAWSATVAKGSPAEAGSVIRLMLRNHRLKPVAKTKDS
jgi:hypothetical protein